MMDLLDGTEHLSMNIFWTNPARLFLTAKMNYLSQKSFPFMKLIGNPVLIRAKKFVPIDRDHVSTKPSWNLLLSFNSVEHSVKGYADDATSLSSDIDVHKSVLLSLDHRAADIDLCFKPSNCISFLFDDSKLGFLCLRGQLRGQTNFWESLLIHP